MYGELIFKEIWIILPIWLLLYFSGYYLSILTAKLYKSGVDKHIAFGGSSELNSQFEKDIAKLKLFGPKIFLFALLISSIFIFLWYISRDDIILSNIYHFLCGGYILLVIPVINRHIKIISEYRNIKKYKCVSGQIRYDGWFLYKISSVDFFLFAILYLIVYLLTDSIPFLGGAAMAMLSGINQSNKSFREREKKKSQ